MPWVNRPPQPRGLKGPRDSLNRKAELTAAEFLAAFQAAVMKSPFYPAHRPAASALGWTLAARWAGCDAQGLASSCLL
jgi:hypothetical protein